VSQLLQRINHFFGMLELCRKRSMARALAALTAAAGPSAGLDFFPCSWQLPNQLGVFLAAAKAAGKKKVFIVKPDAGCQVSDDDEALHCLMRRNSVTVTVTALHLLARLMVVVMVGALDGVMSDVHGDVPGKCYGKPLRWHDYVKCSLISLSAA
jgi:hypothetical protein